MRLLNQLCDPKSWERFYEYKTALACPRDFARRLRSFLDERAWEELLPLLEEGAFFPLPRRALISKMHGAKKRLVYIYPEKENILLKHLTWLLLREYDGLFSPGLYSFRPGRSASDAIRSFQRLPGIGQKYAYKADISNYFNSVPLERLLPRLRQALGADQALYVFLAGLLTETRVREGDSIIQEEKGIMAGTPLASFYANLYLRELDELFFRAGIPYARYSDDIILFGDSPEAVQEGAALVREHLAREGLALNPAKESFFTPEEGWVFLGFSYRQGVLDIAPVSVEKLKAKMRRKCRALKRWQKRNALPGERAAAAFIRIFNRKLLENAGDGELSWAHWFFPVINTADSLKIIDEYARECLRYLISDTRSKARFNVRYETLKALGYRSLVNAYYGHKK